MGLAVTVPLHTLKTGDHFRLPGKDFVAEVGWQSPEMASTPEGQLQVIKVDEEATVSEPNETDNEPWHGKAVGSF